MANMLLADWLEALVTDPAQEVEDVIYDLYKQLDLTQWSGVQLDRIGALVKCQRLGLSDSNYIIKIKAYAAAQNSSGRPDEILTALKLITNAGNVTISFLGNATVALATDGTLGAYLVNNLRTFMESVLAAGIALDYIVHQGDSNSFIFDDLLGSITDGKGFDNITGTGGGGQFTYIII